VKASVMLVFEPAVSDDGVAVRVAVGAGVELLLLLEEDEPPQPARVKLRTSKSARNEAQRRSRAAKFLRNAAGFTLIPRMVLVVTLRGIPNFA